jgi:hypothetical protein
LVKHQTPTPIGTTSNERNSNILTVASDSSLYSRLSPHKRPAELAVRQYQPASPSARSGPCL